MAGNLGDGFYHQEFDEGVGLFDIDMLLFGGVPGGGGGPLYNGADIYGLHPDNFNRYIVRFKGVTEDINVDMDPNVEEEDEQLVQDNHKWQFVRDYPR
uniref:Uncharacterized protein n=1 Tax=Oryza sativa subsp. japonica TaxID=39947 RepID=Q2QQD7_ORYSJ|nr:hypothetical protein LOC_Os12g31400 [Oryza sativa Japonica Group]